MGTNADGRLEVFSFDPQGAYWHIWQEVSGSWSPWTPFDTPAGLSMQASDLTTGQEADGRLVVFLRDSSGVRSLASTLTVNYCMCILGHAKKKVSA